MAKTVSSIGKVISFKGRRIRLTKRRYGGKCVGVAFYTWVDVLVGENWVSLGDPWNSSAIPEAEIVAELTARGL